jgi:hypothetical protein
MYLEKVISKKTWTLFFGGVLKVTDEKSRIESRRIRNTELKQNLERGTGVPFI